MLGAYAATRRIGASLFPARRRAQYSIRRFGGIVCRALEELDFQLGKNNSSPSWDGSPDKPPVAAYKHPNSAKLLALISELLQEVVVLDFDSACAEQFGKLQGGLLNQGIKVPVVDLMIASVAIVHNLTLVTNNTVDFERIPGLRLEDWLNP